MADGFQRAVEQRLAHPGPHAEPGAERAGRASFSRASGIVLRAGAAHEPRSRCGILPRHSRAAHVAGRRPRKTPAANLAAQHAHKQARFTGALTMTTPAEYRQFALECMRDAEPADDAAMRLTM